jgi:hypothetical protein
MCTGKRQTHIRNAPSSRTAVTSIDPTTLIGTASKILSCIKLRGKSPEKPKGFFWSVQGGRGKSKSPRLVFFSQSFLLEKQKKMLDSSC